MGILVWIGLGLLAGLLARLVMPGPDPGGIIVTILIGIAGALVGGFLAGAAFGREVTGINLPSILIATGGAIVLLIVYRLLAGRSAGP